MHHVDVQEPNFHVVRLGMPSNVLFMLGLFSFLHAETTGASSFGMSFGMVMCMDGFASYMWNDTRKGMPSNILFIIGLFAFIHVKCNHRWFVNALVVAANSLVHMRVGPPPA